MNGGITLVSAILTTLIPGCAQEAPAQDTLPRTKGTMTFAVNVHDWVDIEESADTLLRAIAVFEKYKVRGDFYLTGPVVEGYVQKRPDVIERLKSSGMTISYHVRPPHPLYNGFDQRLKGLDDAMLLETIRDYESHRLDLKTGELDRSRPGGFAYVKQVFGKAPVVAPVPDSDPRIRDAAFQVYREMGARMTLKYHETGTKLDRPLEKTSGLWVRPSDFSITRWTVNGRENFWWNRLARDPANADPVKRLEFELGRWSGPRPPFVTSLIHENNWYRYGAEPWTFYYWDGGDKGKPLRPPYDLSAPIDKRKSGFRPKEESELIWKHYEALVAYAAKHLDVATSEDIVRSAEKK